MTLNDPLVLLNLTVLGLGLEVALERNVNGKWNLCVEAQALVWSRCWSWGD